MDNNKENLIKERLSNFEKTPPKRVWDSIELQQRKEENYSRFSYRILAFAASIALIFGVSIWFVLLNNKEVPGVADKYSIEKTSTGQSVITQKEDSEHNNNVLLKNLTSNSKIDKPINDPAPLKSLPKEIKKITISTGNESKEVFLPDSSIVSLNSFSTIAYNENFKSDRKLALQGEAYFDVKKDPKNPFTIKSAFSVVRVLGTSFLIKTDSKKSEDEIFVTSGKVEFISHKGTAILLSKGQSSNSSEMKISTYSNKNFLSWKSHAIDFEKTSLKEVCETLNSYFGIDISIADSSLNNCSFTGSFENPKIEGILSIMNATSNIQYKKTANGYLLSGNGCK